MCHMSQEREKQLISNLQVVWLKLLGERPHKKKTTKKKNRVWFWPDQILFGNQNIFEWIFCCSIQISLVMIPLKKMKKKNYKKPQKTTGSSNICIYIQNIITFKQETRRCHIRFGKKKLDCFKKLYLIFVTLGWRDPMRYCNLSASIKFFFYQQMWW